MVKLYVYKIIFKLNVFVVYCRKRRKRKRMEMRRRRKRKKDPLLTLSSVKDAGQPTQLSQASVSYSVKEMVSVLEVSLSTFETSSYGPWNA